MPEEAVTIFLLYFQTRFILFYFYHFIYSISFYHCFQTPENESYGLGTG